MRKILQTLIERKKLLPILVLFFLFLLLFLLQAIRKSTKNNHIITTSTLPTPTPITYISNTLTKTSPFNGDVISTFLPLISASFIQPLTTNEKASVKITVEPKVSGVISWSNDSTQVFFLPSSLLLGSQTYHATLRLHTRSYQWIFTTASTSSSLTQDIKILQSQRDILFNNSQKKTLASFPWYSSLPIVTKNFFIFFNRDQKTFIIDLHPQYTTSIDAQTQFLKRNALAQMQVLNIPLDKYPIIWSINPQ